MRRQMLLVKRFGISFGGLLAVLILVLLESQSG